MRGRILLIVILLFVMMGCQKKNENPIAEDIEIDTHSSENQEMFHWEQEIDINAEGVNGIRIDAIMNNQSNLNQNNNETIGYTGVFPKYTILAKEVEYTDNSIRRASEWCGSTYTIDFWDSIHADTEKEEQWIQEYGEGTGYRKKCIQWVKKERQLESCTVSLKEASDDAQEFLVANLEDLLGISYIRTGDIIRKKINLGNGNIIEALCVHFVPAVDGFLLYPEQNELAFAYCEQSMIDDYSPDISVDIYISDDGVVCVRYNNPVDIIELKENDNYISSEEAMDCLVEEIEKNQSTINTNYMIDGYIVLDDLHIQYVRIKNGEYYEYVPSYVLCKKNDWNDKVEYQNYYQVDARKK